MLYPLHHRTANMEYSLQNLNLPQTSSPSCRETGLQTDSQNLTEMFTILVASFSTVTILWLFFSAAHVGHMFDSLSHFLIQQRSNPLGLCAQQYLRDLCQVYWIIIYGFKLSLPWGGPFRCTFSAQLDPH